MPELEREGADIEPDDLADYIKARKEVMNKAADPKAERHPHPDKPASNTSLARDRAFPITPAIIDELTARKYLALADHADDYAVLRALFGMLAAAVKAGIRGDAIEVPQ
jgi:hypothetical protein